MKSLVKALFFAVLIMCVSCTFVKPADGDSQVGKDENDSRERVLSSNHLDWDTDSFLISVAHCKKPDAVPGFSDAEKIGKLAENTFHYAVKNPDDAEQFTVLYVLVNEFPDAANILREKIIEASKSDFRFNLLSGMVYGKQDVCSLLENGNTVILFLSRMQNVLEKHAHAGGISPDSRIFDKKIGIAQQILDIYDGLQIGKIGAFPGKNFCSPDARTADISADTAFNLKKQCFCSYSREALQILLGHASSMMMYRPGCLSGIPGSMVLTKKMTNFPEFEITELEGVLVEIIKRDPDFQYWENYHNLFQVIAGYSFDTKSLVECLEEQHKKHPDNLEYLCAIAVLRHLTGNIEESEKAWKTLYAVAEKNGVEVSTDVIAYYVYFEFYDLERQEKAIADLKAALSRYPEDISLCLTAVKLFSIQNMFSDEEDAARRLPDSFEKYFHLMNVALHEERTIDGLVFGDTILQKYPKEVRTGEMASMFWAAYLHAMFTLGKFHAGIKYADEYLKNNPNDVIIPQIVGDFLLNSEKYWDCAEEYLKKGLKTDPGNAILLKNMGWLKYKQGNYVEARRIFFESLLMSENFMSEYYFTEFLSQFGDVQAACGEWGIANALWSIALEKGEAFLNNKERVMLEYKIENSKKFLENNAVLERK